METISDYQAVQNATVAGLVTTVKAQILDGWQPFGEMKVMDIRSNSNASDTPGYLQMMVKYSA